MLPKSRKSPVPIKSVSDDAVTYILRPLTLRERPELLALTAENTIKSRNLSKNLNDLRLSIDLSEYFSEQECEEIKEYSAKANDLDADMLTPDEIDLLSRADNICVVVDADYRSISSARTVLRQDSDIAGIAFCLSAIEIDGDRFEPDNLEETIGYLNEEISPEDFNLLVESIVNLQGLSRDMEKNSELPSI